MVELRLLGSLNLLRDGVACSALIAQPKRFALLCYLALTPGAGFRRRDSLVALFWPEVGEGHARAALRQAIHIIRRCLGESVLLARGAEEIAVNRAVVWCDANAFETHLAAGDTETAMALYAGPLLDGFFIADAPAFEEWLEDMRPRLAGAAARAAWSLTALAESTADHVAAVNWARRAHAFTADDETALGRLLGVLVRAGDRCGAVREYERFTRRLHREYGIAPSRETEAIIGQLRSPVGEISSPGLMHR
jgi:DNA-binding SARP family transcriptional activator